ncbi:MAG: LysE family transporter, partial [Pseudomonadales bacterium]|nr:LysE family transporter [Pseudomonadales bacterium]
MTLELYLSFVLVSLLVIAMPGPNILVIVSTSITAGTKRGLQTVIGTSLAMIVQLAVAALGTTGLLVLLNNGLRWLKWAGVLYLLYLAISS